VPGQRADLDRYAALHAQTYREAVDAVTLIPHMLEAFMARDRGFKKGIAPRSALAHQVRQKLEALNFLGRTSALAVTADFESTVIQSWWAYSYFAGLRLSGIAPNPCKEYVCWGNFEKAAAGRVKSISSNQP